MPPLRSDRAPRACENCRRLKTRCYPSKQETGSCLRCETQNQDCSLKKSTRQTTQLRAHVTNPQSPNDDTTAPVTGVEERLSGLESAVKTLVSQVDVLMHQISDANASRETSLVETRSRASTGEQDAPVFLIKGIAEDVGANDGDNPDVFGEHSDPVSNGTITLEDGYELLSLFRPHYSRWVNFDEQISLEQLMTRVRAHPLLFCSICLVAARHTQQRRTNSLAPTFFSQAKRLLQISLLTIPQPLEFFQAVLLLSLWSTTIGQVPLSIDSWLITSYAIQQGFASTIATSMKAVPADSHNHLSACCTWNHICLSHLQYCVGTGRKPLLQEAQIERCADVLEFEVSQFEMRMVVELKLYWIMVRHCCAASVNLANIRTVLRAWRKEWSFVFVKFEYPEVIRLSDIPTDQPRSQFLEMGYNFAILLACCRLVHSQPTKLTRARLNEMVQLARDTISLATVHTDERTPHLTDHIYHIITFSAITLCRLIATYSNTLVEPNTLTSLKEVILGLVDWLRSIGLTSHISRVLANTIAAHYAKCMAQGNLDPSFATSVDTTDGVLVSRTSNHSLPINTSVDLQTHPSDAIMDSNFQDLAWTTFFDFSVEDVAWPQSSDLIGNSHTPTDGSWTVSSYATSL